MLTSNMKHFKWFNSKTAIIIAGILLSGYLILILTVTNLGQSRLKESQNSELNLRVSNYTENLSFFFDASEKNIANLSQKRDVNTYFSNLAAGMSLQYGLGSSLFSLTQMIENFTRSNMMDGQQIYTRVMIVGIGQTVIVNTRPEVAFDINQLPLKEMETKDHKLQVVKGVEGTAIQLLQTIYHQNKPVAILVATLNTDLLIKLLSTQEHLESGSCLTLVTPIGDILVWNSLQGCETETEIGKTSYYGDNSRIIYFEKKVASTPLVLESWFKPVSEQDIFTSAWFIAGISLLALPVFLGLIYLMRVNNANLVLQTQVELSSEQQQKLAMQNTQLHEEISKRKESESKLEYQATHDELTNLANRTHGMARLQEMIGRSHVKQTQILLLFIDLDNFKQVNDTVGHHAGDLLLKQASKRLLKSVRTSDIVARLGGDEFLVIVPDIQHQDSAKLVASSILSVFEKPFRIEQQEFFVSASIGMSVYPKDGTNASTLLKRADTALYSVKDMGRNGFNFYDEQMNLDVQRSFALNVRLHQAVQQGELEIYYQPILDLVSRKIVAAEALMRWTDSELGFVSPEDFIPLAEKNGLIHRLGDIVLLEACTQAAAWQQISPIKIAINFSSVQFRYCEALQERIVDVLVQTGLPASQLEMEVTESLLIEQDNALMKMLAYLKQLGVGLSIDDFGTGYSALSYLQKFSFTKLKIDRAFINNMTVCSSDASLVSAILAMAKSLKLKVVAEGIENDEQALFLQQHNCEFGQGYLFSRPVPAAEFTQLLIRDQNEASFTEQIERAG
ncbi:putative bifunctional diguanylate cyclase/phosphodiesterase [Shewanella pealeana]|uniref:Diguanylate cyclase/phosphodiesterase n=1 Tax=Shewanella pealeana (strain ATCC 700345 / ANG-SQ1) TaxID=398579 RepID=A8H8S3_SHEPA|nr:GGDEF domain-containing phosphodiesterase [Shewanella pealeana]ABV88960.1 diguanylate cyclase/phosphodiesterase [Shewanella pealeana ATCC 700345]